MLDDVRVMTSRVSWSAVFSEREKGTGKRTENKRAIRSEDTARLVLRGAAITHTRLTALFPGLPGSAGTRKVKPIWILLKQETVSDSGISWAICKSAPRSRQITTPAPHHSVFYRPDALPAAQPAAIRQKESLWERCPKWISLKSLFRENNRSVSGTND